MGNYKVFDNKGDLPEVELHGRFSMSEIEDILEEVRQNYEDDAEYCEFCHYQIGFGHATGCAEAGKKFNGKFG
jgi:hypothetical protein